MAPVFLIDGRSVDSSSEAWRHECEARAILALPGVQLRRAFLEEVERNRGKAVADALRQTMLKIHEKAHP